MAQSATDSGSTQSNAGPRIDSYLQPPAKDDEALDAAHRLYCRLVEKAYSLGHKIFIYTNSAEETQRIDDLLWTFRDIGFVPHAILGEESPGPVTTYISEQAPPVADFSDLLVNLSPKVPKFAPQFTRVIEVVGLDEAAKKAARTRFNQYRKAGCEIQTHDLSQSQTS